MEWLIFIAGIALIIYIGTQKTYYTKPRFGYIGTPIVAILIIPLIMVILINIILNN